MMRKVSYIFILIMLAAGGCRQDTDMDTLSPYLYDYIPTDIGHSVVYDVDSISYSYSGGVQVYDTVRYQLMVTITGSSGSCLSEPGIVCYGVTEYRRSDSTQAFRLSQNWYFSVNRTTYVADQNGLPMEKFTFPPVPGNVWLGNSLIPAGMTSGAYQVYAGWTYAFTSVNVPGTINGQSFAQTATVSAVNNQNLSSSIVCQETYARQVGLVSRHWEVINKQDSTSGWTYPNQANGFRIYMWYHSYTP